jgi:hypothetical protein
LNISGVVSSSGSERGLLGLAFHPQYRTNGRFFVYYTRQSDGAIEIAEYAVSSGNPNQANPTAVRTIITIPHPTFGNHNGGTILFGPDGFLYAGTGDGGSGHDPNNNAQNINSLLGKIIRIDINTPLGQVPPYNIPPTNPYAGATPGADEIYAIGMRNPYRFSFDRGGTRQLWVGDVGQDAIEEVDTIALGGNYGWRVYEGTQCTNNDPGLCNPNNYLPPVFQYTSGGGSPRCSVTGGYVYRGHQYAMTEGQYIFADYCTGEVGIWNGASSSFILQIPNRNISSYGEDEDGELYVVGLGGTVDRILGNKPSADFDGDFRTDIAVFRPSDNNWYIINSGGGITVRNFGAAGDIPAAEDFDADRKTDIAVFRPSDGNWYYIRSSDNTFNIRNFGQNGDKPVAGDYDADGKADFAVFRPATGEWFVQGSVGTFTSFPWGVATDIPVPGDYDADGRHDLAVWRPSNATWYIVNSAGNRFTAVTWGAAGDIPAQGDFDSDTKNDLTVFRPSTGQWFIRRTLDNGIQSATWGVNGDIPVVGDYDADSKDDLAVFRPSTGTWYIINSGNNSIVSYNWGANGDVPIPVRDNP